MLHSRLQSWLHSAPLDAQLESRNVSIPTIRGAELSDLKSLPHMSPECFLASQWNAARIYQDTENGKLAHNVLSISSFRYRATGGRGVDICHHDGAAPATLQPSGLELHSSHFAAFRFLQVQSPRSRCACRFAFWKLRAFAFWNPWSRVLSPWLCFRKSRCSSGSRVP